MEEALNRNFILRAKTQALEENKKHLYVVKAPKKSLLIEAKETILSFKVQNIFDQ